MKLHGSIKSFFLFYVFFLDIFNCIIFAIKIREYEKPRVLFQLLHKFFRILFYFDFSS